MNILWAEFVEDTAKEGVIKTSWLRQRCEAVQSMGNGDLFLFYRLKASIMLPNPILAMPKAMGQLYLHCMFERSNFAWSLPLSLCDHDMWLRRQWQQTRTDIKFCYAVWQSKWHLPHPRKYLAKCFSSSIPESGYFVYCQVRLIMLMSKKG